MTQRWSDIHWVTCLLSYILYLYKQVWMNQWIWPQSDPEMKWYTLSNMPPSVHIISIQTGLNELMNLTPKWPRDEVIYITWHGCLRTHYICKLYTSEWRAKTLRLVAHAVKKHATLYHSVGISKNGITCIMSRPLNRMTLHLVKYLHGKR